MPDWRIVLELNIPGCQVQAAKKAKNSQKRDGIAQPFRGHSIGILWSGTTLLPRRMWAISQDANKQIFHKIAGRLAICLTRYSMLSSFGVIRPLSRPDHNGLDPATAWVETRLRRRET